MKPKKYKKICKNCKNKFRTDMEEQIYCCYCVTKHPISLNLK